VAIATRPGEGQPRVIGLDDVSLTMRPRSIALLDLYLCGACLTAAAALTTVAGAPSR
jgi:hypothetical protein